MSELIGPKTSAIEISAAALSAATMKPYADFLSFGTNALTQYTFAVDREDAAVEKCFDDSTAVILRLLQIAHGDAPDMPFSICGEVAGDTAHIPTLLQCGVRALRVAPPLAPVVKEAIRECWCNRDLMPQQLMSCAAHPDA